MNPISGYTAGNSAKTSGAERSAADSFTQVFTKAAKNNLYASDKTSFQPAERKQEVKPKQKSPADDAGDNADQLNANAQAASADANAVDDAQNRVDELSREIREGTQQLKNAAKNAVSGEEQAVAEKGAAAMDAVLKAGQAEFVDQAMSEIEKLMKTFGINQNTGITKETFEKLATEEILDYQVVDMQYAMKPGTNPTNHLAGLAADQQSYLDALRNGLMDGEQTVFDRLDSGELAMPEWMKSIYKKPEKLNTTENIFAAATGAQQTANAVTPVVIDTTGCTASEILTKIVENIKTSMDADQQSMEIAFKPSVLGGLEIKMSMTSDGFTAQIFANTKYAQSLINGQIAQLTEALKERGITVNQIEVLEQNPEAALNFSQQSFFGFQQEQRGQYKPDESTHSAPEISLDAALDAVSSALENAYTQLDTDTTAATGMDVTA